MSKIVGIDKNMKITDEQCDKKWINGLSENVACYGFAYEPFLRLPQDRELEITASNKDLMYLTHDTAGGQLSFSSDTTSVFVKVKLNHLEQMSHMTFVGMSGVDCYIEDNGKLAFAGSTKFDISSTEYTCVLASGLTKTKRNFLLNLPLYNGVEEILIGIDKDSSILPVKRYYKNKRIVMYGTSITQGGCASRPGMATSNIISRTLDCEVINLGFSGNGFGEPIVASIIGECDDIGLIIIDYVANIEGVENGIQNTLYNFIDILKAKAPSTPILVLTRNPNAMDNFIESKRLQNEKNNEILFDIVAEKFMEYGDVFIEDIWYGLDEVVQEMTVDGVHLTDLGMYVEAQKLAPIIKKYIMDK